MFEYQTQSSPQIIRLCGKEREEKENKYNKTYRQKEKKQ